MTSPASQSDRILADARAVLARPRQAGFGGGLSRTRAIGARSAALRRRHLLGKVQRIGLALVAIVVGAGVIGAVIHGIGQFGVLLTLLAMAAAVVLLGRWPHLKPPALGTLNQGDVAGLVGRTQLWLEGARPALPAPAVQVLDRIGGQLDTLEPLLAGLDPALPAATEVRQLVGEHLPGMIEDWRRIPAPLRREARGGRTADEQLADGLARISGELDALNRDLAAGQIDALAIRGRYLATRYGDQSPAALGPTG